MSNHEQLKVWIGCLHCCNGGRLTGDWYPANTAASVTTEALHERVRAPWSPAHEELWVMDFDGCWPAGTGEMGLAHAQKWGEAYDECPEHLWAALPAWVETGAYIAQGNGDIPVVSDFIDAYKGEYDDVEDYARCMAEDTGLMTDWPETAVNYFDWERWSSDLEVELTTADAPGGGIYVFDCP